MEERMKKSNICLIRVLEGKRRNDMAEIIYEEIMAYTSPEPINGISSHNERAKQILNRERREVGGGGGREGGTGEGTN